MNRYKKRVVSVLSAAFILSLGLVLLLAGTASAADRDVGPGQTYPTINAAIAAAINGDHIVIHDDGVGGPQNYPENVVVNKELTIENVFGEQPVTINPAAGIAIDVQAGIDNVTIQGQAGNNLNITTDAAAGTYGIQVGTGCDNMVIRRCNITTTGAGTRGISFSGTNDTVTIGGASGAGVVFTFDGGDDAIDFNPETSSGTASNVTVSYDDFNGAAAADHYAVKFGSLGPTTNIRNNTTNSPIVFMLVDNPTDLGAFGSGSVAVNLFEDSDATRNVGLLVEGKPAPAATGQLSNFDVNNNNFTTGAGSNGVEFFADAGQPLVAGNFDLNTIAIRNNNFSGMGAAGYAANIAPMLQGEFGANCVSFSGNWWSSQDGPGTGIPPSGERVTANVDYSPWWLANYVSTAHPWNWRMDTSNSSTINEAVNLMSATDTLNVLAGAYPAATVSRSITITGTGSPTVVSFTLRWSNITIDDIDVSLVNVEWPAANHGLIQDGVNALDHSSGGRTLNVDSGAGGAYNEAVTVNFPMTINGTGATNPSTTSFTLNDGPISIGNIDVPTVNVGWPGTHGLIQDGVTAVNAGGVVNVANGAYAEAVTIGKNLTINGSGPGCSTTSFTLNVAAITINDVQVGTVNVNFPGRIADGVYAISSGGTVNVSDGAYGESVTVGKNLIINGSAPGCSTTSFQLSANPVAITGIDVPTVTVSPGGLPNDAVDAVIGDGTGTVSVAPGTYNDDDVVLVDKPILFQGTGGPPDPIIQRSAAGATVQIANDSVDMKDFDIRSAGTGAADYPVVIVDGADTVNVRGCTIDSRGAAAEGIRLNGTYSQLAIGGATSANGNTFLFDDTGNDVALDFNPDLWDGLLNTPMIIDATVRWNTFTASAGTTNHTAMKFGAINGINIADNTVGSVTRFQFLKASGGVVYPTATGIGIRDNTFIPTNWASAIYTGGILLQNDTANGPGGADTVLDGAAPNGALWIWGNIFANNQYGVCFFNNLTDLNVNESAVQISDATKGNYFVNNNHGTPPDTGAVAVTYGTINPIDATQNFWGLNAGPTHPSNTLNIGGSQGDLVSDNVTFIRWRLTGMTGELYAPLRLLSTGNYYSSISAALLAAGVGETVNVLVGTDMTSGAFDEHISVSSEVTLQGPDPATGSFAVWPSDAGPAATITGAADDAVIQDLTFQSAGTAAGDYAMQIDSGCDRLTLKQCSFNSYGAATSCVSLNGNYSDLQIGSDDPPAVDEGNTFNFDSNDIALDFNPALDADITTNLFLRDNDFEAQGFGHEAVRFACVQGAEITGNSFGSRVRFHITNGNTQNVSIYRGNTFVPSAPSTSRAGGILIYQQSPAAAGVLGNTGGFYVGSVPDNDPGDALAGNTFQGDGCALAFDPNVENDNLNMLNVKARKNNFTGNGFVVDSLAYDTPNGLLYGGTAGQGAWKCSTPTPAQWSNTGTGVGGTGVSDYEIRALIYDAPSNTLFAGTAGHGVWSKTGAGAWTDTGGGIANYNVNALAYDGVTSTLYAGTSSHGVWSYNGGAWADTGIGFDIQNYTVNALTYVTGTLYAGTSGHGVWSKPDAGAWGAINNPPMTTYTVKALAYDGASTLYAGMENYGVWSKTGAGDWGDTGGTVSGYTVNALAYDGVTTLYAGTGSHGVWSKTGVDPWGDTGGGIAGYTVDTLTRDNSNNILYAGTWGQGAWRRPDATGTWSNMWKGYAVDRLGADPIPSTLSAQSNWWNSQNGPLPRGQAPSATFGDPVSDTGDYTNVNYSNYCTSQCGSDPLTAHIESVTKSYGYRSQTLEVVIEGANTHFDGTSVPHFGSGFPIIDDPNIQVNDWTVTDKTHLTADITIKRTFSPGAINVNVRTVTGGEDPTPATFTVKDAILNTVSPTSKAHGQSNINVTVSGSGTHFGVGSTADFGQGITVHSVTAASTTTATVNISIAPTATIGTRDVVISSPDTTPPGYDEVATLEDAFTVRDPKIISASPASAKRGDKSIQVTIVGTSTSFQGAVSAADFGTGILVNWLNVQNATTATANISITGEAALGARNVNVTTGDEVPDALSGGFTVEASTELPHIDEVSPDSGRVGTEVTVRGTLFGATQGTSKVTFGSTDVTDYATWYDTQTKVKVPQGVAAGVLKVKVVTEAGSSNEVDFTVTASEPEGTAFYFAEGSCRPNFDSYICVLNPGGNNAEVKVTYMLADGTNKEQKITVPPSSRYTIAVKAVLGEANDLAHDFSAKVETTPDAQIVVERSMYFNYAGKWTGGHDVVGATATSRTFYFAEGTCRPNFDPYICIQNPGTMVAGVRITYMLGTGGTVERLMSVQPRSRTTVTVKNTLGEKDDAAHDFSAKVETTNEATIIAERSIYFNYQGFTQLNWTGGHDVVGASSPAKTFYFAEGTCRPGFDPYLCIQNPGSSDADVLITYMLGSGGTKTQGIKVNKSSRYTVYVKNVLGEENDTAHDFSAKVESTSGQEIIAERPMYFNYQGFTRLNWNGGHDVVGATSPAKTYYFAEGTCRPNFDPYICIQNPGGADAEVTVSYMLGNGGAKWQSLTVPKNSRKTIYVKDALGEVNDAAHDFSAKVECTNGQEIIAERPMYFNYQGFTSLNWTGGHDVVGYTPTGK